VQFIDDRRFSDTGISRDQHQLRHPAPDDAVEGGNQHLDVARPSIQVVGDQQPVRCVVLAKREIVDAAPKLPLGKTTPQIPLHTGCCLITLLGHLGG
jgi:hypothetical protein